MVNRGHESKKLTYRIELPGGQERLRELILYVAGRAQGMHRFGLIKLNKIVWRADFTAFADRGVPVTGRAYQRLRLGPAAVEMQPLLAEMNQDELIKFKLEFFGVGPDGREIIERRPVALATPSLRWFSPDDLSYVEKSILHYWAMTGMETSDDSHGVAWQTRHDADPMPYESALLSDGYLTEEQLDRLKKLGAERGWKTA